MRFCILEYSPSGPRSDEADTTSAVALVLWSIESRNLRILIHPELRKVVQAEDLSYIESVFADFLERAKSEPESLLKQVSSLGIGPLVTRQVGPNIAECPLVMEQCSSFVELKPRFKS